MGLCRMHYPKSMGLKTLTYSFTWQYMCKVRHCTLQYMQLPMWWVKLGRKYLSLENTLSNSATVKVDIFAQVNFRIWQSKQNFACSRYDVCARQFMRFCYKFYYLRVFNYAHVLWFVKNFHTAKYSTFTV